MQAAWRGWTRDTKFNLVSPGLEGVRRSAASEQAAMGGAETAPAGGSRQGASFRVQALPARGSGAHSLRMMQQHQL